MNLNTLIRRNVWHFRRTHLAVVAGVAAATAALAGSLLVGDSVRASLREQALGRLGAVTHVITSEYYFREQLADELSAAAAVRERFGAAAPIITLEGLVTHEASGRRATSVQVYGIDDRFLALHAPERRGRAPAGNSGWLSPALAAEFGARAGDSVLVRMRKPSEIPTDSLLGDKEDLSGALRLRLEDAAEGAPREFSLQAQQGPVRSVFVPLGTLQRTLKLEGRANTILLAAKQTPAEKAEQDEQEAADLRAALKESLTLEDLGLRVRPLPTQRVVALEAVQILLPDSVAETAKQVAAELKMETVAVFSYLATTIRAGNREVPYSLVTAVGSESPAAGEKRDEAQWPLGEIAASKDAGNGIWLNDWAAAELRARPGDRVTLEYLVWEESGRLETRAAEFELRGVLPTRLLARDTALVPTFPGISESPNLSDWNPPFPVDLKRIRPADEDYWHRYRTTPKAVIPLATAQKLWASRHGKLTSVRFVPPPGVPLEAAVGDVAVLLRQSVEPARAGVTVAAVRAESAAASRGAVNFSAYFTYFSFFLVVSAVLLAGLFFKLGVEQRQQEIGLLKAVGFADEAVQRVFVTEGGLLAFLGTLAGLAGAVGYGGAMLHGLRTWWVGAVGTTDLRLHVEASSLLAGGAGALLAALLAIRLTLRGLRHLSPRELLHGGALPAAGTEATQTRAPGRRAQRWRTGGLLCAAMALVLLGAAATRRLDVVPAFFGSGSLLLLAQVMWVWGWLEPAANRTPAPLRNLRQLGMLNARWRPGRSLLCVALVASATFILVAVNAFRRAGADPEDPKSGTGGFALVASTLVPIPYDPEPAENKQKLNLSEEEIAALQGARLMAFRLRPGDDASCLNLYRPRQPRILGVPPAFVAAGRFSFASSLAQTPVEKEDPWRLLEKEAADGAVPAVGDANSLKYVLNLRVGETLELPTTTDPATGRPLRLRIVAALRDSIFQSELLIADTHFRRLFPYEQGFRVFLAEVPPERAGAVAELLEQSWRDYGFDATATGERLAAFHRVENTYISTFQALGGLGLLLGTAGLAAVLLRNVLERRRELALLRAMGYRPGDLRRLILAENALLLVLGLGAGVASALVAIAPAIVERGGGASAGNMAVLALAVLATGLAATIATARAALRAPLLEALRSE